jgi:hypothetical protein
LKIKSFLAKPFASYIYKGIRKEMQTAVEDQERISKELLKTGKLTDFGKDHKLGDLSRHEEYVQAVPIRDYEQLKPYIEKIKEGKHNVLWKGKPLYFAKTSGTTSGVKYIPISKESISNHINTARNALLSYIAESGNAGFTNGKMIFLSGSPVLDRVGGIPTGRLSGIVNHHVPSYLRNNQLPSYETNCIEEWETKLDKIVEETINQDMSLISGIPPWMQMYFDELMKRSGKNISELFPNFSVMVQGGVNFEPYKAKLFESIGKKIDSIELFPASEGFFAAQDKPGEEGMLLFTDHGVFMEFMPVEEYGKPNPKTIGLQKVELGKNYALVISTNGGLWRYLLGDTISFTTLQPYRIKVSGRVKHYINAFGEEVIVDNSDKAVAIASEKTGAIVNDYTAAPLYFGEESNGAHEWLIEFEKEPDSLNHFVEELDKALQSINSDYEAKRYKNIALRMPVIHSLQKGIFTSWLKTKGKLGGQHKVPRLSNDRSVASPLSVDHCRFEPVATLQF